MRLQFHLGDTQIHLWSVHLDDSEATASEFRRFLRPDELDRANSFRSGHLRNRFVIARGSLRLVLARYLSQAPQTVQFRYGLHGKPGLFDSSDLAFNVSHSGALAAIAVSEGCEVGVDIEEIRPVADLDGVALQSFSESDYAELASTCCDDRQSAFFRCWTRKEALVKATGEGLSSTWHRASVGVGADSRSCRSKAPGEVEDRDWTVTTLQVDCSHAAALAFGARKREIQHTPTLSAIELLRMFEDPLATEARSIQADESR